MSFLWIAKTYGSMLDATVDKGFLNFLENKRRLFLLQVCFPTVVLGLLGCIWIFLNMKFEMCKETLIFCVIKIIFVVCIVAIFVTGGIVVGIKPYAEYLLYMNKEKWYDENRTVIHALGIIDGYSYTNSKEALEKSFLNGNRVFECDMILTADNKLVACHDWNTGMQEGISGDNIPTKDEFMSIKIYDQYTPLSIDEILTFMKEHEEVYLITDSKSAEVEYFQIQFQELVNTASVLQCEEVLERVIVQIYHPYMYDCIDKIYSFNNYIFTLYQSGYRGEIVEFEEYAKFCRNNGIDVITMNVQYYSDELKEICDRYDLELFVHTVNDKQQISNLQDKGIGVYTDGK